MEPDGFGGRVIVSQPLSLAFHLPVTGGIITHNVGGRREDDSMLGVDTKTQRLSKRKRANGFPPPEQNQPRSFHKSFCTERDSEMRPGSSGRSA